MIPHKTSGHRYVQTVTLASNKRIGGPTKLKFTIRFKALLLQGDECVDQSEQVHWKRIDDHVFSLDLTSNLSGVKIF